MTNVVDTTAAAGATNEAPEHLKNDKRFNDLLKQAVKFGEEASLGKDSLPKLAHAVVKAAADGIIDTEAKNKKGEDVATQIYSQYVAGEGKKALHEHSTGGKKANISKLRQLINMGALTDIDAVEVMQAAFEARNGMAREEGVKIKAAYPFYVDVARAQLAAPKKALTKSELEDIVQKDAPAPKELEKELERAAKILEGLVTGENRDKIKDSDPLTEAALQAIKERLDNLATLRNKEKLAKAAALLGYKIV